MQYLINSNTNHTGLVFMQCRYILLTKATYSKDNFKFPDSTGYIMTSSLLPLLQTPASYLG